MGSQFQLLDQITGEIQMLKFKLVHIHIQTFAQIVNKINYHPTLLHLQRDMVKTIISDGKIIKTNGRIMIKNGTMIDNIENDLIKIQI
jgi:hypothetical protein